MMKYAVIAVVWGMISGGLIGCSAIKTIDKHVDCTYNDGVLDCQAKKDV